MDEESLVKLGQSRANGTLSPTKSMLFVRLTSAKCCRDGAGSYCGVNAAEVWLFIFGGLSPWLINYLDKSQRVFLCQYIALCANAAGQNLLVQCTTNPLYRALL